MKAFIFTFILVLLQIIFANGSKKGSETSTAYLSETNVFNYNNIKDLVVLGDSFSSTGTNYHTMKYSGANVSGGKNWPLQLLKYHKMKLWNFAKVGAVVDFKIVPRRGYKVSFVRQGDIFVDKMSEGKTFGDSWNGNSTLVAYWIGVNDIRCIKRPKDKNVDEKFDKIIKEIFQTLEKMYNAGAKNFLIINIPPLIRHPFNSRGSYPYYEHDTEYFNNAFLEYSEKIASNHTDANIMVYNAEEQYNYIIDNCEKFQFKDCSHGWKVSKVTSLKKSLFHDFSHLSYNGNKYLAKDINKYLLSLNNE